MNISFNSLLQNRIYNFDLRKQESASSERLQSSIRVGRGAGSGYFVGNLRMMPYGIGDKVYRDSLRNWMEEISLFGYYTDIPVEKANLPTISTTKRGTTAWNAQRGQYVMTLTASGTDMEKDDYVSILYNSTPRVFKVSESISATQKVLWPNVHIGSNVLVSLFTSFRCYALKADVELFVGTNTMVLSDDYEIPLYEYVG